MNLEKCAKNYQRISKLTGNQEEASEDEPKDQQRRRVS
jgi:hypothetical protein